MDKLSNGKDRPTYWIGLIIDREKVRILSYLETAQYINKP